MGTGELRMIHSRVLWMLRPVERSITVSAPQRIAQTSFSTSFSIEEVTAEVPMLALTFTRKLRPMIIGSSSGWLILAGMMARPAAISERTNSGVTWSGICAPQSSPSRGPDAASRSWFSRMATNSISGVTMPARISQLRGRGVARTAQRLRPLREFRHQPVTRDESVILGLHMAALVALDIAARHDPVAAPGGQTTGDIGFDRGVCVGAGTVINRQGCLARC